jgi:hypothetical protein
MSYTVHTSPRVAIVVDVIQGESLNITPGLLLSIEGQGSEVHNCVVIPAATIGALIKTLELAQSQLKP